MIQENVSLAPHTYYKIGGPARYFAQPESTNDLAFLAAYARGKKIPYFILGAGSNVLIDDAGLDALVIQTSKLDRTLSQSGSDLEVGSSLMVIQVLRHCMQNGLAGFEFLVGIPGNMGGVMSMNAGTKSGELKDAIREVTVYDLATDSIQIISREDLKYSYRAQHFLEPHEIILRGRIRGRISEPKRVQNDVTALLAARKKSQPIDKPSCGSVFKNPDPEKGLHAWKVIEEVGLKGHRIGNAQISEMHSNFIVNLGGATAADVRALIDEAKTRVRSQLGIELEEEVRIVTTASAKRLDY